MPECFFAHLGGCQGRLVKAHLIPKSSIRTELISRFLEGGMGRMDARDAASGLVWDERTWRWMCGGLDYGNAGHHGAYDAKQIRIDEWPQDFVEFLVEYDIHWMTEAYAR